MVRFFLVCFGLVALAGPAFAGGEYQHTKDGKTTVWNSIPRPGDISTWNGDRDGDGYATGFGTLTWYTQQRGESALYAVYYGNMVHGKFDGPVNLHTKGKTAHAFFTEGTRTSRWARGPAPNWRSPQKSPEAVARETPPARENRHGNQGDQTERTSAAESRSEQEPQHLKTETPKTEKAEATPAVPAVAEKREEAAQGDSFAEKPAPAVETPEPSISPSPSAIAQNPAPAASEQMSPSKFDGSARELVGPPSSLRTNSTSDGSARTTSSQGSSEPSTTDASSTPRPADLTEAEAIDLADAEAIAQGYNLGDYVPPKVDYSAVKDRWSVLYDRKSGDSSEGVAKSLIIAVEDKTKKAAITSPR